MPHSFGYRARTRDMFARDFRKTGMPGLKTYLTNYKVGDYVDIKVNGAVHKGMPHKYYHGRTGIVYNVTKSAVGVEVNKIVGNRQMKKRINIRVEHVRHSKCRTNFLARVARNEEIKKAVAKKEIPPMHLKRLPAQPKPGRILKAYKEATFVHPMPYEILA